MSITILEAISQMERAQTQIENILVKLANSGITITELELERLECRTMCGTTHHVCSVNIGCRIK